MSAKKGEVYDPCAEYHRIMLYFMDGIAKFRKMTNDRERYDFMEVVVSNIDKDLAEFEARGGLANVEDGRGREMIKMINEEMEKLGLADKKPE